MHSPNASITHGHSMPAHGAKGNTTSNATAHKPHHHKSSRHNASASARSPSERRSLLTFLDHGKEEAQPSVVVVNSAPPPAPYQQPFPQQLAAQFAPAPMGPVSSPAPVIAVGWGARQLLCTNCSECVI